jgi:hypothetical protein
MHRTDINLRKLEGIDRDFKQNIIYNSLQIQSQHLNCLPDFAMLRFLSSLIVNARRCPSAHEFLKLLTYQALNTSYCHMA